MVQCEECNMWRLVFSKHKLTIVQRQRLQVILEGLSYSCGAKPSKLELGSEFKDVEIRDHVCGDTIEKLYWQYVCTAVLTIHLHLIPNIHNAKTVHIYQPLKSRDIIYSVTNS